MMSVGDVQQGVKFGSFESKIDLRSHRMMLQRMAPETPGHQNPTTLPMLPYRTAPIQHIGVRYAAWRSGSLLASVKLVSLRDPVLAGWLSI